MATKKVKKKSVKLVGPPYEGHRTGEGTLLVTPYMVESRMIRLGLKKKEDKTLTDKEVLLAEQFVIHGDYQRAGVAAGFTPMNARASARRNLIKPHMAKYVAKLRKERAERCKVTSDQVVEELMKLGFSNIADILSWDAKKKEITFKDYDSIPASVKACIQEINESPGPRGKGKVIKVKLYDKSQALQMLGRHLGLFTDKTEHSVDADVKNLFEHLARLDGQVK